jgi:hypothetical protein
MMGYPSAYFGYLLVRGEVTGAYPYFFIDVSRLGYAQVLANAVGFSLLFLVLAALAIRTKR